jgi:predicted GIY-YIG superfamily endonuclease
MAFLIFNIIMIEYFVYIFFSLEVNVYYKGYFKDVNQRLICHLEYKSNYTSKAKGWKLVYEKEFET